MECGTVDCVSPSSVSISLHPPGPSQHVDKASPSDSVWLLPPERMLLLSSRCRHDTSPLRKPDPDLPLWPLTFTTRSLVSLLFRKPPTPVTGFHFSCCFLRDNPGICAQRNQEPWETLESRSVGVSSEGTGLWHSCV